MLLLLLQIVCIFSNFFCFYFYRFLIIVELMVEKMEMKFFMFDGICLEILKLLHLIACMLHLDLLLYLGGFQVMEILVEKGGKAFNVIVRSYKWEVAFLGLLQKDSSKRETQ